MNILEAIVEHKREEVAGKKRKLPLADLRQLPRYSRRTASLEARITDADPFAVIAEIKRSSPTAGTLRTIASPATLGADYEANGAAGISVLTDEKFFSGTLDDLTAVRQAVALPLLRKDFIVDEYQLHEAKAFGADAVLLIAGVLDKPRLAQLHALSLELELDALVELYDERDIDLLDLERMKLIGINNRSLRTFAVDVSRTFTIAKLLPHSLTLVSESGLSQAADLRRLKSHGIKAALIGEHLMKAQNPGRELRRLIEAVDNETPR